MGHIVLGGLLAVAGGVAPAHAVDGVVVFNEIMYHPATNENALEWFELHNQLAQDVDLSGWKVRGGVGYDLPDGTIIPGEGYLVVSIAPWALATSSGYTNALGPFEGQLGNAGEELRLINHSGRLMDQADYGDSGEWPVAPDGSGAALCKIDPQAASIDPSNWSWSRAIGGTPGVANIPVVNPAVVFNEAAGVSATNFWLELVNRGTTAVELGGYRLVVSGAVSSQYALPPQVLAAGDFRVVTTAELGTHPVDGDKVFLFDTYNQVDDAVVVDSVLRGRAPGGAAKWLYPGSPTPGGANSFSLHAQVVINEIMYHHHPQFEPFVESPEEWIELYNRGNTNVDLSRWRLADAVDFQFPAGTVVAAGSFLVVARDAAALSADYPAIDIVGNYERELGNNGDRIVLLDERGNPADEVRYYTRGRWPDYADGGGSSLELRHPDADNSIPEAWAASREGDKSAWQSVTYRGVAANDGGPTLYNEFVMGLLDAGEALVDDISVTEDPDGAALQLIQNGHFNTGTATWRIIGNHSGTTVPDPDDAGQSVLHLTAPARPSTCTIMAKPRSRTVAPTSQSKPTRNTRLHFAPGGWADRTSCTPVYTSTGCPRPRTSPSRGRPALRAR